MARASMSDSKPTPVPARAPLTVAAMRSNIDILHRRLKRVLEIAPNDVYLFVFGGRIMAEIIQWHDRIAEAEKEAGSETESETDQ